MLRHTPGLTRTHTLFPYTTLLRSVAVDAVRDALHRIRAGELLVEVARGEALVQVGNAGGLLAAVDLLRRGDVGVRGVRVVRLDAGVQVIPERSEEHTSELQSLMRISYAVFCLKKKKQ